MQKKYALTMNPVARQSAVVAGEKYRFTVLTDRLIRQKSLDQTQLEEFFAAMLSFSFFFFGAYEEELSSNASDVDSFEKLEYRPPLPPYRPPYPP